MSTQPHNEACVAWTRWLAATSTPFVSASITAKVDRAMRAAAAAEPAFTARACALLAWHTASFIPPTDRWATALAVTNGQAHLPDGEPFTGGRKDHLDMDPNMILAADDEDGVPTIDPLVAALADPGPAPLTGVIVVTALQQGWRRVVNVLEGEPPELMFEVGTSAVRVLAVRAGAHGTADGALIADLGWTAMAAATHLVETGRDVDDALLIRERVDVIRHSRLGLQGPN
jgi:hypothetical protein